jgi:hypothetical protein
MGAAESIVSTNIENDAAFLSRFWPFGCGKLPVNGYVPLRVDDYSLLFRSD